MRRALHKQQTNQDKTMSIMFTVLIYAILVCLSIVGCSCFEWLLHKFVMHRPFLGFKYPFKAHQLIHHETFGWKADYHLQNEIDRKTIPMAWWNGPVLICIATLIPLLISYLLNWWAVCIIFGIVVTFYFIAYEYFHWCMHEPRNRWFEQTRWYKFIDNHHRIHHLKMNSNLNVVFPFADWLVGSLVLKSPIEFPQPTTKKTHSTWFEV